MKDKKPHLWIPEQEIVSINKNPTGRSNNYHLKHEEHGAKLSQGLQNIIDFLKRVQTSTTLDEHDLITFNVLLQEKEDFAIQKNFIETEGMTINAVKDKRHAIVSAPKNTFKMLQKRVARYRDQGTKNEFQYIQDFTPFCAEDKQSAAFLHFLKKHPDSIGIDVQMLLLPDMPDKTRKKAEQDITEKIKVSNGRIKGNPFQLTNGNTLIRAEIAPSSLQKLADDPRIYLIEQTSFFRVIAPSGYRPFKNNWSLNNKIDIASLPTVVILDDGVCLPDALQNVVVLQWSAHDCDRRYAPANHGTPVASRAAFGYLGAHPSSVLTPRARIIDAQITNAGEPLSIDLLIQRLQEAVAKFFNVAKIFNLSYNADRPIEGDRMSILGSELDSLSLKYGVRFVISAGNHNLWETQTSLQDIIEDDDSRISSPADSMLGITVGAVVGQEHPHSLSKSNEIAPYSRRGPGFYGFHKPNIVAYGATCTHLGSPVDAYAICMDKTGYQPLPGTSFTAPIVSGDLAQILEDLPADNIGLAQALLYNSATPLYTRDKISQDELDYAINLYGHGLSSPINSKYSSEDKISFVSYGTMNRLTKKHIKFYIPTLIAAKKLKRGQKKLRVTVTCIAQPPFDSNKGSEYSAAYIYASIHFLNSSGTNTLGNPAVSDNRIKWDTCYHFSNEFSSFSAGDWEVWLELFTRWGVKDDDEIPYSLVITVEDLTQSGNLYSEIIREAGGRFTSFQSTRVRVN